MALKELAQRLREINDRGLLNRIPLERVNGAIENAAYADIKEEVAPGIQRGTFPAVPYVDLLVETEEMLRTSYPPPPNMNAIEG